MTDGSANHLPCSIMVAVTLGACALAACRSEPRLADVRLDARLAGLIEVMPEDTPPGPSATRLWRRDGLSLVAPTVAALTSLRRMDSSAKLVMVSAPAASSLAVQLADDPRVLAYLPSPDGATVHAVLPGSDPLLLHAIASAAHTASHSDSQSAGHACGNLERLSLRALAETSTVTPPMYAEGIKLDDVATLAAAPEQTRIGATIKTLEAMGTRYHTTSSGKAAPASIKALFEAAAGTAIPGLSVKLVDHVDTDQQSVVVTIPGTEDPATTAVVGAHLDSINRDGPTLGAPGADDDASGIATLVEILRVLAAGGASFRRTVELHGYAAEEVGLIGSQELAYSYSDAGRSLAAVMQIDMNSYSSDGNDTIYLVTNDTSATLRRSLKDLLNTYLGGRYVEARLSGGTSDHRSWTNAGFQAVFPFENPQSYNHALHTLNDTSDTANNLALSSRFASLGLAFLAHHAGLVSASTDYDAALAAARNTLSPDLKLATVAAEQSGAYHVAVASPETVTSVEVCSVADAGSMACTGERATTVAGRTGGGRAFFITAAPMQLGDGSRLAVFGYDATDALVAQRTVLLKAR